MKELLIQILVSVLAKLVVLAGISLIRYLKGRARKNNPVLAGPGCGRGGYNAASPSGISPFIPQNTEAVKCFLYAAMRQSGQ